MRRWYLSLALSCAFSAVVGCGSPDANRESRAPRLEPAPAAAEEDTADSAGFAGDISGVVITTEQGGQPNVYVVSPEGKQLLFTGGYALKWVDAWKTLAMADKQHIFRLAAINKEGKSEVNLVGKCIAESTWDVSANGLMAAVWADRAIDVYSTAQPARLETSLTREWITEQTGVRGALYSNFVEGIAFHPSGRLVAVTVDSERVEETSGTASPAVAIVDLEAGTASVLCHGAPIVWLDADTLALLDVPAEWQSVPDSEAIIVTRSGDVVGRLSKVMAIGAGPNETVLVLREDSDGRVYVEVRSRDLKVRHERYYTGIADWRDVNGFRITYIPHGSG